MGTSAHIVYEKDDGYKSLYVRIDGTIWGLGRHLIDGFKEKEVKHLFSRNQAVSFIDDLKKEESNKKWYLSADNNLDDYHKILNETDNYIANNLIVKLLKNSKTLVKSFSDNIFNHCNEEFTYLFSDKAWWVAGYGSQEFIDLKTVVNFAHSYELLKSLEAKRPKLEEHDEFADQLVEIADLLNKIKMSAEEDKSMKELMALSNKKAESSQEKLEKHAQTMRKRCYSLMERYNKENTSIQRFVKSMLRNEPNFSTIEKLASEQGSIILSESLSENLKDNKKTITKTKI